MDCHDVIGICNRKLFIKIILFILVTSQRAGVKILNYKLWLSQ